MEIANPFQKTHAVLAGLFGGLVYFMSNGETTYAWMLTAAACVYILGEKALAIVKRIYGD